MFFVIILIHLLCSFCLYSHSYGAQSFVIRNLRRRESQPLYQSSRRFDSSSSELRYRRTLDIREDRRYDILADKLLREERSENQRALDKLHNEMRWLTIDTDEGIGIGI